MQIITKIYEFVKIWWKILIGALALLVVFVLMKKLGISLSGIIGIVRNFLKPSEGTPQTATQVSETITEIKEAEVKNTGAQKLSEKTINGIDELLYEIQHKQ